MAYVNNNDMRRLIWRGTGAFVALLLAIVGYLLAAWSWDVQDRFKRSERRDADMEQRLRILEKDGERREALLRTMDAKLNALLRSRGLRVEGDDDGSRNRR